MNKDTRIEKIQEIINQNNVYGKQEIPWKDKLESFDVYQVPLEYLIYNKYNWRILSRTKSLETQNYLINSETKEWKELIEKLLWESKIDRNKKTLESISKLWQEKVWIITRDWIIIDWNRRAMLLNKAWKSHFKAIILPVTLDQAPNDIEELETTFQMWEDWKVDYNPIEKYLKAEWLQKRGIKIEKIAQWMWKSDAEIVTLIEVMTIMHEYLEFFNYNWIFTQLDWREDPLINLTKWLRNFYSRESWKWFDWYEKEDVDDLKFIAFDYIRVKYEWKEFRLLAEWQKWNHLFWDAEIWKDFCNEHNQIIKDIKDNESEIDIKSSNLESHLNDRDNRFKELAHDSMRENLEKHHTKIGYRNSQDEPIKLTNKALDAIKSINPKSRTLADIRVVQQVEEINRLTTKMLQEKSPEKILDQIIELLDTLHIDKNKIENCDDIIWKLKEINQKAFELKKKIWG